MSSFHDQLGTIFSALAGSAISGLLAKAYVQKSLKDLEAALEKCHELARSLAVTINRVEMIEDLIPLIQEHDRAIAALTRRYQNGKVRGLHGADS